jgi:autotransporter-associated beta strand protein
VAFSFSQDRPPPGDATYTLNPGGRGEFAFAGLMNFLDSSTAGSGTFIVQGSSTDENAILQFFDDSDGGTARIELVDGGRLLATFHSLATLTIGSLEGNGAFTQAPGETAIGSNNLSTTFSGVISSANGRPGPITKIGTGRLTLTGANTYTGGTIVNQGTLLVDNTSGSGTGTGDVTVNTGTLGGDGAISGAVTVGTGSGPASISPGAKGKNDTGLLTIQNVLTFGSQGSYQFQLDSDRSTVDTLSANGVTIGSGTLFQANDLGASALTPGTIFLVIDNTATTPIAGAFNNLPEGAIVTVNGNNLQASYEGGDGNDLTLTVVP